ncbi:NAD(P)/FAD-dependent oxidoreductase [Nocardioides kongjuensis]|uniref:NADPH-dependent 2,4-dienoyl-CoA reductase/sulfur reductase-like enzyme n=2 Tax=Nocardioides kongjuensis TaxID=349522 RepID=A0A852RJ21_9ACTN|nr:FAD-dependent oxidoreductase [Nocardioides kongjuensis]NYD30648.1 NADPH-dependent 2,4-dienoyl-CoA reductase/sulfur reductase-like enzyme [Nocardioides kongjuensis]
MSTPRVVVVGGSLGGLRAAEQLRVAGHTGSITVLGAEPHLPYNRPPLSKEVLASGDHLPPAELAERLAFRRRASTADVDFRLGDPVVASDLRAGVVWTGSGAATPYEGLVVATGLRPRRLDVPGPTAGRHVLRTVEDSHALRADLGRRPGQRVVVVGAGFIGCESAATLRTLGHDVTVVEPVGTPMERVIGAVASTAIQRHLEAAGIRFVLGTGITGYLGGERVEGVVLGSGRVLPADVVVEAVGSLCNTEWLAENGLDLADGVLTDNRMRVVGAERVVAVGDVARFPNPVFDDVPRRVEHWSIPTDTARVAAATLVADLAGRPVTDEFRPVPSFWSDQLGLRLQSLGSPALADEVVVAEGDPERLLDGLLVTYHREGRPVGTLAVNLGPARQRELREQFSHPVPAA